MPPERRIEKQSVTNAQRIVHNELRQLLRDREKQSVGRPEPSSQGDLEKLADQITQPGPMTRSRERKSMKLLQKVVDKVDRHHAYQKQVSQKQLFEILALVGWDKSVLLDHIVEKAKPDLPAGTKSILNQLKKADTDIRKGRENSLSGEEYVQLIENALQKLSPETLKDYKARNIKFVSMEGDPGWTPYGPNEQGKWEVKFPHQKRPIEIMLRAIEVPLQIEHQQANVIPSPQRRAEIAARVFKVNEKLGEVYGWNIKGYEWAEKYRKFYYDGIREAFNQGSITIDTPKHKLEEIGHSYARNKLIESVTSSPGEPKIFSSFGPAAYFEERLIARKQGQQRIKVDQTSNEFKALLMKLKTRKEQGKDYTLIATIMPNEEIYVQPYFISRNIKSMHVVNAAGNPLTFSGEVKLEEERFQQLELTRIGDQSGHYRTHDENNPWLVLDYAVSVFQAKGIGTSKVHKELSSLDGRDLDYKI